jgi:hypothetical protein
VDDLDISDDCWDAPTIGDLQVGDVCEMVPLAVLVEDRIDNIVEFDEKEADAVETPMRRFVPFRYSFALVIGCMTSYSVVAAIGTAPHMPPDLYESLVESGRWARSHVRLPAIPNDRWDAWDARDGLAFLSLIESFPTAALLPLRVATMTDDAREVLQRRVSRTVAYD